MYRFLLILLLALSSCQQPDNAPKMTRKLICGRDIAHTPIYRAKVPMHWQQKPLSENITDTKQAICEFLIDDPLGEIRITIHNFPNLNVEERIPTFAQIARWQRQFSYLDPSESHIEAAIYGGFAGQFFEGSGTLGNRQILMLAWAMQIGHEHFSQLKSEQLYHPEKAAYFQQMAADYTIKVVGPKKAMQKYRSEIIAFAHGFELIDGVAAAP